MQADIHSRDRAGTSDTQAEVHSAAGGLSDPWMVFGHVKFEGVGLQYSRAGPWALQEVDLEIQPGQSVGIVGRTGQPSLCHCICFLRVKGQPGWAENHTLKALPTKLPWVINCRMHVQCKAT